MVRKIHFKIILGSGIFSTHKIYVVHSGNKYRLAITCTFGRRLRMSTISAVPTCTANTHVCENLRKYRVLRYLIWFLEGKCSQQCLLEPRHEISNNVAF